MSAKETAPQETSVSSAIPAPVKKLATNKILWLFAIGQLGWSTLSGIISNWLVYFYMPGESLLAKGHTLFITQTAVFLGFVTVIGGVTALGRVFDAFTDPWIASKSDRCKHRLGRRIPFLRFAAIPFGIITVLVFCAPFEGISIGNNIWLLVFVLLFYLAMTCYCTPYNALIPELGRTQNLRINVSTYISITYFVGTAFAYAIPTVAGFLEPSFGSVDSFRVTIAILAVIAVICMLVPAFGINEKVYADTTPSATPTFASLKKTFKNKHFQTFVCSDVLYWIALTMFQTGLPFYITELMGLDASWTTLLFIAMTGMSFLCYPLVNVLAKRLGKKKMVSFAFIFFAIVFAITTMVGTMGIPGVAWGFIVAILAAIPMAILGVLPQAVVADIAEADAITTGEARQGMFYATRTFAFKLGQSISMLAFTSIALIGTGGFGYRLTAIVAAVFCLAGGLVFMRYREKDVFAILGEKETVAEERAEEAAKAAAAAEAAAIVGAAEVAESAAFAPAAEAVREAPLDAEAVDDIFEEAEKTAAEIEGLE